MYFSDQEYRDPVRSDYVHVSQTTMKQQFKNDYDFFGISLVHDTDYQTLFNVFNSIDDKLSHQTSKDNDAKLVYNDYNKLKTMGYKDLLDLLDDDESDLITCSRVPFWY